MKPAATSGAPGEGAGAARLTVEVHQIGGGLADHVRAASGASPMACYQCAKCSSGCPVANRGDLKPHELVRLVQIDQRDTVLRSRFIWECTSCHTCVTRCPQKVDIPAINDALRALSVAEDVAGAATTVPTFNEAFLNSVSKRGRVHELGLMAAYKVRTRRFMEDVDKAPVLLSKGKLPLLGDRVPGRSEREAMFRRAAAEAAAELDRETAERGGALGRERSSEASRPGDDAEGGRS